MRLPMLLGNSGKTFLENLYYDSLSLFVANAKRLAWFVRVALICGLSVRCLQAVILSDSIGGLFQQTR